MPDEATEPVVEETKEPAAEEEKPKKRGRKKKEADKPVSLLSPVDAIEDALAAVRDMDDEDIDPQRKTRAIVHLNAAMNDVKGNSKIS